MISWCRLHNASSVEIRAVKFLILGRLVQMSDVAQVQDAA